MTVTVGDKTWRPAYAVLAAYVCACALFIAFAPADWRGFTSTASALARLSDFPSVTAFCADAMWASLPLAVGAFWATAPLKIREKPPAKPLLILVIGFVFFGLITTPFVFHYMLFQLGDVDLDSQGRLARSVRWASHSKIGLLVMEASHFVAMVCLVWLSYIAIPGAFFKLRRSATQ